MMIFNSYVEDLSIHLNSHLLAHRMAAIRYEQTLNRPRLEPWHTSGLHAEVQMRRCGVAHLDRNQRRRSRHLGQWQTKFWSIGSSI